MEMRVGVMPYLNSEVFYYSFDSLGVSFHPLPPRAMAQAADRGELDAGPIPLVECFRLEDRFVPLGGYCIATVERARSILLFSKVPIEEMSGTTIGITDETSTSAQLLRVLLARKYSVEPREYVNLETGRDAYLLIGDNALRAMRGDPAYRFRYDLGQEWYEWTGLPFVFARWIVRHSTSEDQKRWLYNCLERSIKDGLQNVEAISHRRHVDLNMTPEETAEYVESFHYVLGERELQAIDRFRELLNGLSQG